MLDVPDTLRGRHSTRVADFSRDELELVLDIAARIKQAPREEQHVLPGRALGIVFQKPSTRTRVSLEVGMAQLGGHALYLRSDDLQLGRGEDDQGHRDRPLPLPRRDHDPHLRAGRRRGAGRKRLDPGLRDLEEGYGITAELVKQAGDRAIVLHYLPAHYGEESTEDVLYGQQSAVWDQAENRLHAQKGLLALVVR